MFYVGLIGMIVGIMVTLHGKVAIGLSIFAGFSSFAIMGIM